MEAFKQKILNALSKIDRSILKMQKSVVEDCPEDSSSAPIDSKGQQQQQVKTIKTYIDEYSDELTQQEKMLIRCSFENQLNQEERLQSFYARVKGLIKKLQEQNQNEFSNISDNPLKIIEEKQSKKKIYRNMTKKTEPTVESHPQYFRIDHQLTHRLFEHYRVLPLGIKSSSLSFEEKEHNKLSMNYHKILQIFKDAGLTLQINQKLLVLRAIKKISFNQNLINQDEFIKIFKYIVHGLGYKERTFEELLMKKAISGTLYMNKPKKKSQTKNLHRIYRFKTQSAISKNQPSCNQTTPFQNNVTSQNKSRISSLHNDKGKGRSQQQRTGMTRNKKIESIKEGGNGPAGSYLLKAMEHQKISKITWESLFAMKQNSMHFNIEIPDFVQGIDDPGF